MVPGPVKAVLLLFPIDALMEKRNVNVRMLGSLQKVSSCWDKTVFWVKQTVSCCFVVLESETECGCLVIYFRYHMHAGL